jgi:type I restriction enzyme R subunit
VSDETIKYSNTDKQQAIKAGKLGKTFERVKLVITRGKDDPPAMFKVLGNKDYRKDLDRQFKIEHSNIKIAIGVDMWLTGFDWRCAQLCTNSPKAKHLKPPK